MERNGQLSATISKQSSILTETTVVISSLFSNTTLKFQRGETFYNNPEVFSCHESITHVCNCPYAI